jgi:hypothetical protein
VLQRAARRHAVQHALGREPAAGLVLHAAVAAPWPRASRFHPGHRQDVGRKHAGWPANGRHLSDCTGSCTSCRTGEPRRRRGRSPAKADRRGCLHTRARYCGEFACKYMCAALACLQVFDCASISRWQNPSGNASVSHAGEVASACVAQTALHQTSARRR